MTPLLAVAVYLLIQFGIGIWVSRRIRTESDYIVAGRRLGYTLTTFSIFATWFGAETVVGSAGRAYGGGVSLGSAEPFGYGVCLLLMGLVFAAPLWRRKLTTLADLYRERFSPSAERVAAIILIPSSILWAAAQMRAFGHVLSATAVGLDVEIAIAVAAAVAILYTAIGGMLADAITDLIQGALLVLGLVVIFIAILPHVGGIAAVGEALADPARVQALPRQTMSTLELLEEWAIPIAGSVLATELVGRIIAARSGAVARRSSYMAGFMYLGIGIIPLTIGIVAPAVVPSLQDAEQVLPYVAMQFLPTVLYAVFAGALISAILSTVDSTLLVSSALLSHNILVPLLKPRDEARKVRMARAVVVAFGLIAYVLAHHATGVLDLVQQASAFGSAGALVTITFGLFTPWGGGRTAVATLLTGVTVYLAMTLAGSATPFLISLGASLLVFATGALLGRTRPALSTS